MVVKLVLMILKVFGGPKDFNSLGLGPVFQWLAVSWWKCWRTRYLCDQVLAGTCVSRSRAWWGEGQCPRSRRTRSASAAPGQWSSIIIMTHCELAWWKWDESSSSPQVGLMVYKKVQCPRLASAVPDGHGGAVVVYVLVVPWYWYCGSIGAIGGGGKLPHAVGQRRVASFHQKRDQPGHLQSKQNQPDPLSWPPRALKSKHNQPGNKRHQHNLFPKVWSNFTLL